MGSALHPPHAPLTSRLRCVARLLALNDQWPRPSTVAKFVAGDALRLWLFDKAIGHVQCCTALPQFFIHFKLKQIY
jgi:hypothetical protein